MSSKSKLDQWTPLLVKLLFVIYMIALVWILLFKFSLNLTDLSYSRNVNLMPFGGSLIVNGQIQLDEILLNVAVFIPLGVYLCMLAPKLAFMKKFLTVLAVTLSIEVLQYTFAIGASDITDVVTNTLGGVAGIAGYTAISHLVKNDPRLDKWIAIIALACTVTVGALLGLLLMANR